MGMKGISFVVFHASKTIADCVGVLYCCTLGGVSNIMFNLDYVL